ncbi:LacI family DNA-binding transcriptional regulator [Sneathiella sp. CAU 1612]|uniref:LacI family DNA-binding transcriptional regulator n=1 Tax=Sneathiella sedimenti TaxID=2816034 RepID=A0ABS3F660_9PROT|nr:LacI family DNA-binding transcriptional regulator [Sneathiella sedimenti]MBO0334009.1 LacI family DNA-binding transcriptional regulator [Sneathiella sedimenti]
MVKRTTIRDVAAAAGVSVTTVSHTLNGKGRIDAETAKRVREFANKLGYKASAAARSLQSSRTGHIAIQHSRSSAHQVSLIELEYFIQIVAGASNVAAARGYHLSMLLTANNHESDWAGTDGVILIDPISGDPLIKELKNKNIVVVTTGRDTNQEAEDGLWVDNDNVKAILLVLEHLTENGAKQIALLTTPGDYSYSLETLQAYKEWCVQRGQIPMDRQLEGGINETIAYHATLDLFSGSMKPDAIHCVTDRYAMGAMMAVESLGLKVPNDCLITAGTDSDAARLVVPPLTALDLHPNEVGVNAATLLIDEIEGLKHKNHHIVPVDLNLRGSSSIRK